MKKKEVSIILLLSAIVIFIVATVGISITAMFTESAECAYAGDGEELPFSDDTILVVLTSEATLTFKKYTSEDFVDIGVLSVDDLMESSREMLYDQLYGEDPSKYKKNWMINKNAFRTILCLTLEHKGEEAIFNAIEKLMKREDVESAEPNYKIHPETTSPNDPLYSNQWGLNGNYGIDVPSAWEYTSGSYSVKVGVIDTGIDGTHDDLVENINYDLSRDFSISSPYIPSSVSDINGHGTGVAGVIGAVGDNDIGITGVAQNIELVSLKIYPCIDDDAFVNNSVLAINYATTAPIPNLFSNLSMDNILRYLMGKGLLHFQRLHIYWTDTVFL